MKYFLWQHETIPPISASQQKWKVGDTKFLILKQGFWVFAATIFHHNRSKNSLKEDSLLVWSYNSPDCTMYHLSRSRRRKKKKNHCSRLETLELRQDLEINIECLKLWRSIIDLILTRIDVCWWVNHWIIIMLGMASLIIINPKL